MPTLRRIARASAARCPALARVSLALTVAALALAAPARADLMVIGPHPDDDVLMASGVIARAVSRGEPVYVVLMTNGDVGGVDMGYRREGEAISALAELGVPEDRVIFLGYPDGGLGALYSTHTQPGQVYTSRAGVDRTYGNRGLGRMTYHRYVFGAEAPYNGYELRRDLEHLFATYRPSHVFTTSTYDNHSDHSSTGRFVRESLAAVSSRVPGYVPTVHENRVWTGTASWPAPAAPDVYFTAPSLVGTPYVWAARESLDVPLALQNTALAQNPKYRAIAAHVSQGGATNYSSWVHKDEFFWSSRVTGTDRPPVPDAGFDQSASEGATVTLDGSRSFDPDGTTPGFAWRQVAGPSVTLTSASTARPTFVVPRGLPSSGVRFAFELVVRDATGASVPDATTVTASGSGTVDRPPVAVVGADQIVAQGVTVQLTGSSSYDPDGQPLSYEWTQTLGVPVLDVTTVANPTFEAPSGATTDVVLEFELVVSDGVNRSSPARTRVTVRGQATSNLARLATATASSSESVGTGPSLAIDGNLATEWVSNRQRDGAWLTLAWSGLHTVDRIVLYDRASSSEHVQRVTLTFSDGTTMTVGPLANGGGPTAVTFPARSVTWVRVTITQTSRRTRAAGLAEVEVFGR